MVQKDKSCYIYFGLLKKPLMKIDTKLNLVVNYFNNLIKFSFQSRNIQNKT